MIDSMHQSWLPRVVAAAFPGEGGPEPFALLQRRQPQVVTAARYRPRARPPSLVSETHSSPFGAQAGGWPGQDCSPSPGPPLSTCCPQMPLQKLLFSATLTQNPEKLQQLGLYQPRLFSTGLAGRGPSDADGDSGGKYTFPTGLTVSRALGEGRGGVTVPGPGQSRAVPTAPLRALPPALQASGGSAPDPGFELLKGPLLHQLPRELPQVRLCWAGEAGRRAGRSGLAHQLQLPLLPQALFAGPGLWGCDRGRVLLPPQPRPAEDDPEAV